MYLTRKKKCYLQSQWITKLKCKESVAKGQNPLLMSWWNNFVVDELMKFDAFSTNGWPLIQLEWEGHIQKINLAGTQNSEGD